MLTKKAAKDISEQFNGFIVAESAQGRNLRAFVEGTKTQEQYEEDKAVWVNKAERHAYHLFDTYGITLVGYTR